MLPKSTIDGACLLAETIAVNAVKLDEKQRYNKKVVVYLRPRSSIYTQESELVVQIVSWAALLVQMVIMRVMFKSGRNHVAQFQINPNHLLPSSFQSKLIQWYYG